MMRGLAPALVMLLGTLSAAAAGEWRVDGKIVPENAWSKSDDGFGARLILTDKPEELYATWQKQGAAVLFSETGRATRGLPLVAVIFFTGCAQDERGLCESTVRFTAFSPDGKPYGHPQGGDLWVRKRPPAKDGIQLGDANMGIVIEPKDPLGDYKVRAEIQDRIGKKTLVLERSFTAAEAQAVKQ
jgi:hypothetical protein